MKTRKTLLTLMMAALLIAMLAVPAFAATIDLPLDPPFVNSDAQKGWGVNGTDMNGTAIETDLTLEQLQAAKYLVLEVSAEPAAGLQFVLQNDNGWGWNQTDLTAADVYQDGKLVFELANMTGWDTLAGATAQAKFFVCYYDPDYSGLGVTKAYLTDSLGGDAPAGDPGTGNAKTGDSTVIFLAIGGLVLAAGATVLVARKVKA